MSTMIFKITSVNLLVFSFLLVFKYWSLVEIQAEWLFPELDQIIIKPSIIQKQIKPNQCQHIYFCFEESFCFLDKQTVQVPDFV